MPTPEDDIP